MSPERISRRIAVFVAALPIFFVSNQCLAQAEQVLAEVGAMGRTVDGGQGVVRPDFANKEPGDYESWIALASQRSFRGFAISSSGTALVLDGNMIREYTASGSEKTSAGFPKDCTALVFTVTRKNGSQAPDSLSECGAFTPLNDGSIRIAGKTKGGGFVIISYDPDSGDVELKADGTPPSIIDMDGDQFADAADRNGLGYWAVGDRKKVIFFPLEDGTKEQDFQVVATLNGADIDSITPFGDNRVIVALASGELLAISAANGNATSFATLPTGSACGLGRKDPQKFTVRGDPGGTLFVGNRGCHEVIVYSNDLQLAPTTFNLDSPKAFLVEGLDWQSGQGGDFNECQGASLAEGCDFGLQETQAVMWDVDTVPGSDTSYRMFQFTNLVDCRWSSEGISAATPCPVFNCQEYDNDGMCILPDADQQVLNLVELLTRADESGAFKEVAFGDRDPPPMLIPPYMRGEKCFPTSPADNGLCNTENNGYRFHTFFAVTDAVFTGNFFVEYDINEFREGSFDPCFVPLPGSEIPEINETANLIVYNSDSFDTVSSAEGGRGGVIINDGCSTGRGSAIKWSSQSIGFEPYDESDPAYVVQAGRMMAELQLAKTELLCARFRDPDTGDLLGPLLHPAGPDCAKIQAELDQMKEKQETCFASLFKPLSGGSGPNCNAFFTKAQNLLNVLNAAAWPIPDPQDIDPMFRANYEGEFRSRLRTLILFMQSYVLNGPADGLDPN